MKAAEAHETIQIQYNLCRAVPNQQVACKDLGNGVIEVSGLGSSRATTFAHVHNDGSLSQLWAKTIDTQRRSLLGMGTAAYSDPMRVVVRAFERELAVRISIVAKSEAPERTYEAVSRIQQSIQECVYAGTCYHSLALQTNTSSDSDAAIAAVVGQHQFQKVRDNVLRAANVLTTEVSRSPDAMHLSLLWDSCNVVLVAAQTLVDLIMCDIVKDKISLDRVMLEGSYWRKTVGGNVLPDTKVKRISAVFKNPWKRSPKISKYKQTPPLAPLPLEYRSLTSTPLSTPLEADEVTYSSNVSAVHLDESSRTRAQTHSHKSSNTYIPSTSPSTRRRTDSTTHVHLVDDFNFDVVQNAQDVAASIQGNKYISAHVVKDKGQQLKSISDIHTQGRKYARSGSDTKMLAVDSGQLTLATSTSVPYDMYAYTQSHAQRAPLNDDGPSRMKNLFNSASCDAMDSLGATSEEKIASIRSKFVGSVWVLIARRHRISTSGNPTTAHLIQSCVYVPLMHSAEVPIYRCQAPCKISCIDTNKVDRSVYSCTTSNACSSGFSVASSAGTLRNTQSQGSTYESTALNGIGRTPAILPQLNGASRRVPSGLGQRRLTAFATTNPALSKTQLSIGGLKVRVQDSRTADYYQKRRSVGDPRTVSTVRTISNSSARVAKDRSGGTKTSCGIKHTQTNVKSTIKQCSSAGDDDGTRRISGSGIVKQIPTVLVGCSGDGTTRRTVQTHTIHIDEQGSEGSGNGCNEGRTGAVSQSQSIPHGQKSHRNGNVLRSTDSQEREYISASTKNSCMKIVTKESIGKQEELQTPIQAKHSRTHSDTSQLSPVSNCMCSTGDCNPRRTITCNGHIVSGDADLLSHLDQIQPTRIVASLSPPVNTRNGSKDGAECGRSRSSTHQRTSSLELKHESRPSGSPLRTFEGQERKTSGSWRLLKTKPSNPKALKAHRTVSIGSCKGVGSISQEWGPLDSLSSECLNSRSLLFEGGASLLKPPTAPSRLPAKNIMQIRTDDFVQHCCLTDAKMIYNVKATEFQKCGWSKPSKEETSPNILAMIRSFDYLALLVASEILLRLTAEGRAEVIEKYIKIADGLAQDNNYNSLKAVLAGLQCQPIFRLSKTWALVHAKRKKTFEQLGSLMSEEENYRNYRDTLKKSGFPCIPYLGVYLTDVTYTYLALQSSTAEMERRVGGIIEEFQDYQRLSSYQYQNKPGVHIYMECASVNTDSENYTLSLQREQKQQPKAQQGSGKGLN
ncbi:hypothetical protein SARC_08523 [Sphaeroforma arctica JP610]|uniref:Ras-GEF domain-containing protein n=1 Tax=Sphaeroforma arctica JP610 TaxID=667725 RepID=A0A0L0FQM4_9EUKA|nr:hypothetical protein SARC_08523 [Sphaeroforma arctica JP610]KNC79072.1 hypothetical protein SARC_08523 [Sphaeroforma arctica JP610]|eukprot:XP_014152974.1 hypothetical protein SARC_08523 [Sphaeroforma arctica JP610]